LFVVTFVDILSEKSLSVFVSSETIIENETSLVSYLFIYFFVQYAILFFMYFMFFDLFFGVVKM